MPTKQTRKAQKPAPKSKPKAKPPTEPIAPKERAEQSERTAERPDKTAARWRAAEERLLLRLAVLEDVVRRANADLARRVTELERRHTATRA